MARQYISARFSPEDFRAYTYHNDGEPVAIGDMVCVQTGRGERNVEVVGIVLQPAFPTKPILGRAEQRGVGGGL